MKFPFMICEKQAQQIENTLVYFNFEIIPKTFKLNKILKYSDHEAGIVESVAFILRWVS